MSSDLQPFAPAVPPAPPADPLADVVAVLAGLLRLEPEEVDARRSFRFLGLGSLQAVEFVAGVNARCGTRVKAPALFDHATPAAFARHIARELRPERAASPPSAPDAPVRGLTAPVPPPAGRHAGSEVLDVLREELARLVRCDPWEIDAHAPFALMDLDSTLSAEFMATVNRIYGTGERVFVLGAHPDLAALAAHVAALTAEPATTDVEMLLDAVRDNLLTIDQALALLPRRG
ncbi:phosphopantetheine-binding protein [Streptomyces prasinus]|uniref:phosphopantetheine-binding protein n=1 Tax=Streptomyces prasinus TaxID=67345 RepID=UPI00340C706C